MIHASVPRPPRPLARRAPHRRRDAEAVPPGHGLRGEEVLDGHELGVGGGEREGRGGARDAVADGRQEGVGRLAQLLHGDVDEGLVGRKGGHVSRT